MKDALFRELLQSVREGGQVLRKERRPSRKFALDEADVRTIRERYGLSQAKFAALMGISVGTLRNWEQGRRRPEGSARVLLRVVSKYPEIVLESAGEYQRAAPSTRSSSRSVARKRVTRR